MHEGAHLASIQALVDFRASVCTFKAAAQDALGAAETEIRRTVEWLDQQTKFWHQEARARQEDVAHARNELARRKLMRVFGREPDCTEQQDILDMAVARLQEAEDKTANCRHWASQLEIEVREYEGPARQLAFLVEGDMVRALAMLDQKLNALEAYLGLTPPT